MQPKTKQICVPAKPSIDDVQVANCGSYLAADGWFYRFYRLTKTFDPQEVFLRRQVPVDDEPGEEEETYEITEAKPDYHCPPAVSWHVQRCGSILDDSKYIYKGLTAPVGVLSKTFPKASMAELTGQPLLRAKKPNERWQAVSWNDNFERWVVDNMNLPPSERQPPVIRRTLVPEDSLTAAHLGGRAETVARRRPLPFLDDKYAQ